MMAAAYIKTGHVKYQIDSIKQSKTLYTNQNKAMITLGCTTFDFYFVSVK